MIQLPSELNVKLSQKIQLRKGEKQVKKNLEGQNIRKIDNFLK